ncbi:MAG: bifunctional folylpolyglutamate synthase/dihydrofolate synthase [Bacteroidetes bacterium]|nr:bifunctional folylpolyglutamate synthase/dihydrofolate synthase [Bacteroidota bacterium]
MNYEETLDYLFAQLPMFHRIGAAAYKANLDNTHAICEFLDHPENKFRSIHIAGTNGKGSTSHMLAAILQSAGYKTGLYTSPHLIDFRERIRINGEMISKDAVVGFVEKYKTQFEKVQPSFFEWTVGLAFDYFANEKVEIAVIETGLGGRLDSTNVITPLLSVITNISWDHANLLGDTLKKIAAEKAGIIKKEIPVVIGEVREETAVVFTDKAASLGAPIVFAEILLRAEQKESKAPDRQVFSIYAGKQLLFDSLEIDLAGHYQRKNILTVIESVLKLNEAGFRIEEEHIRAGLSNVRGLTGLMGRWQTISESPRIVCDVGHNEDGIREILNQLALLSYDRLHIVFGVVNDKDVTSILKLLPVNAKYYFCKANLPRALGQEELKNQAQNFGLKGEAYDSVYDAFLAAKNAAEKSDFVFIGGSTFVVAEILQALS